MQEDDNHLQLHLPALRRADTAGGRHRQRRDRRLRLERDSFAGAPKLRMLSLDNFGTVLLWPGCFVGLMALAKLRLEGCGLVEIPPALTALGGSLTSLALPSNHSLQLVDNDIAILLALRKLRNLDLRKSVFDETSVAASAVIAHVGYPPALWNMKSLQHIANLPGLFLRQNDHVPALHLSHDSYRDLEANLLSLQEADE